MYRLQEREAVNLGTRTRRTIVGRLNTNWNLASRRGYGDAASDLHTLVFRCGAHFSSQVDLLSYTINKRSAAGRSTRA